MSEADEAAPRTSGTAANAESVCDRIIDAFKEAANAFIPPEAAGKHFRESRIQFLLGIRELVDSRISRLSRNQSKGTRVTVE